MEQTAKNRLSTLSGFPVKDALTGLSTGNRIGKPAERKQEILTPQKILNVPQRLWGQIALDPCWCKGALTNPIHKFEYPVQDGLKEPWVAQTFINCPYKDLKKWLAYGQTQPKEQIWFCPVRTHRKWWRAWRDGLSAYCELNPIAFEGYSQVFPAPLLLGYYGSMPIPFENLCREFKLGDVYAN